MTQRKSGYLTLRGPSCFKAKLRESVKMQSKHRRFYQLLKAFDVTYFSSVKA